MCLLNSAQSPGIFVASTRPSLSGHGGLGCTFLVLLLSGTNLDLRLLRRFLVRLVFLKLKVLFTLSNVASIVYRCTVTHLYHIEKKDSDGVFGFGFKGDKFFILPDKKSEKLVVEGVNEDYFEEDPHEPITQYLPPHDITIEVSKPKTKKGFKLLINGVEWEKLDPAL